MIVRSLLLAGSLLLASVVPAAHAKSDGPEIKVKEFDKVPTNPYYFEDTDTVMLSGHMAELFISTDAASTWEPLKDKDGLLFPNRYHSQSAVIYGPNRKHWATFDAAKTWREFEVPEKLIFSNEGPRPFTFHGKDPNKVIINAEECLISLCRRVTYYTTDGFKTIKKLLKNDMGCYWAVGTPVFAEGQKDLPEKLDDRIFCIWAHITPFDRTRRLIYSDTYFSDDKFRAVEIGGREIKGVNNIALIKKYLVLAASSEGTSEAAIYVSKDAVNWGRAEFYGGPKIRGGSFTVLESTNYSIQVNAASRRSRRPIGSLFTSDSAGTSFTMNVDGVNEDEKMYTDFEQVSGIQGIFLINLVDNAADVKSGQSSEKKIVSRISFDDGRTFKPLKCGDKDLHLHSITRPSNMGRIFSSPAPGLIMGVGNTGDKLKEYENGNLYVSNDAGVTWRKALDKSHKYEFGDQGSLLVAIADDGKDELLTDEISYSLNHGKDWKKAKLPHKAAAIWLTTTPDSTSLQFLLIAQGKGKSYAMSIDFSNVHERKCEEKDFERWPARLDEKGEPDCLMGHKQFYRRRKADADCFVKEKFKEPVPETEACKCTKEDFECSAGFRRNKDYDCEPDGKLKPADGKCKNPDDKFMGPSGYRMIPGDDCIKKGGVDLEKEVERPCKDVTKAPASGQIAVEKTTFETKNLNYRYLERSDTSSGDDETVILRTDDGNLFVTRDHGKTWQRGKFQEPILQYIPHKYDHDVVYLLTQGKKAYWSIDRAHSFHSFEGKLPVTRTKGTLPLFFHPDHPDWLIWIGGENCNGQKCTDLAYYSKNRGDEWDLLLRGVGKCMFAGKKDELTADDLIFCSQHEHEDPRKNLRLVSSVDQFAKTTSIHFDGKPIVGYAKMSEFIVAATKNGTELQSFTSVDGKTFAHAAFPPNYHVGAEYAYTVLDSSTHSIFLHVTDHSAQNNEFGSILKSNSNGTSYVMSLRDANRNKADYVDFEKIQVVEGVAMANIVANADEVRHKGQDKKFRSMISHNDASEWALMPPPKKDVEGHSFDCKVKDKGTEECALHIHGYTERRDSRDSMSSGSAVGLIIGVGNVGPYLTTRAESDTFMSRDAGITWHQVRKGRYQWEFGDQGSIVVIVAEEKPTKVLSYSLDEGETWTDFEFTDKEVKVEDISTVPSDTSRNFLLWARGGSPGELIAYNVDFTGLKEREKQCVLKKESPEADDYYLWSPKHPQQKSNCLFGHVSVYHRKRPEAKCYNGPKLDRLSSEKKNCECTRQDYECDYNYERQSDGSCALVKGLQPADPMKICKDDPEAVEYFEPTGYRKLPVSTCEGGHQLDHIVARPCPNKKKEFEKKHPGIGGFGIFLAIFFPVTAATAIGYWAFSKWDGKFGRIRLGESQPESLFAGNSPLITIPVAIVAGTVAVITALPLLFSSLWRSFKGYTRLSNPWGQRQRPYASRDAFAARRGEYVGVVDDEDELLGAEEFEGDDDEEV
ncbi:vacuolar protein sorting/targeting protein PEP1 [Nannizzia gypsea CBS 118893]|uniref:Vacuolar protein sorting/targeting protein 10 n=1 Tax=Arthroderma gypseum (strain ATCC MYA-4604 / CBS 118893) TaxID=535722 RepID=VPS10_ARTGP|nr:vacuolar protein sorting/targeting protein PEP1 [Nannizzia gypsea CBS 118893]E4UV76.1 RecName: Full=Vacuolar protein sorting/targeting protein 10; AltName: Full=Carboxypeptidase Y receptor; Short=CPY receptor; AltName: Full=Sortilin VPS10; AltName: Full=Vacuolar carboxypeptidase sorting receptor VPS10; Flags: Precursor [Nannizzia gypsea CBS 118893]EFR02203.1 vacuolar protein sorting/targeting protein PEP1 [Nannizzia gypsea CBS 118893]